MVSVAGLAPFDAEGLDWFAGMIPSGAASLRAAAHGRGAKERHESGAVFDPEMFTAADHAALAAPGPGSPMSSARPWNQAPGA